MVGLDGFVPVHGPLKFPNVTAAYIFGQVKDFLSSTEREIVILEIRIDDNVAGGVEQVTKFVQEMLKVIGTNLLITKSMVRACGHDQPAACTPGQLNAAKGRVIIRWSSKDNDGLGFDDYLWPRTEAALSSGPAANASLMISADNHFPTADNTDQLKTGRDADLKQWSETWATYQTQAMIHWWRLGVHTTTADLRGGAFASVPLVVGWLNDDSVWGKSAWNMVVADLFTEDLYLRFAEAVIARNGRHQYR
jgi:hypothetical protein